MKLQIASFGYEPPTARQIARLQAQHRKVLAVLFGAAAALAVGTLIAACSTSHAIQPPPAKQCVVQTCAGLVACIGELPEGVRCEEMTEAQARQEGLNP